MRQGTKDINTLTDKKSLADIAHLKRMGVIRVTNNGRQITNSEEILKLGAYNSVIDAEKDIITRSVINRAGSLAANRAQLRNERKMARINARNERKMVRTEARQQRKADRLAARQERRSRRQGRQGQSTNGRKHKTAYTHRTSDTDAQHGRLDICRQRKGHCLDRIKFKW